MTLLKLFLVTDKQSLIQFELTSSPTRLCSLVMVSQKMASDKNQVREQTWANWRPFIWILKIQISLLTEVQGTR